MSAYEIVIAEPTKTKTVTGPVSPAVKQVLKEEHDEKFKSVPDDKNVYWSDVKKAYPELESQLKPIFNGKDRISVKDMRDMISKVPEEQAKFWVSETTWDSTLQRDLGMQHKQIVVQLNISKPIIEAIHVDPILAEFFKEVSKEMSGASSHPTHSQTIAWARVYPMADKYVVEEIQSDIFGASTKLKDVANSRMEEILNQFTEAEQKHIQEFLHKHFVDWDKKLLATVVSMARKAGINDVWIFDIDQKKKNQTSPSKLERFYKVVPRDLGFKRDTLHVDDKQIPGWHRVVASTHLKRLGAIL